MGLRDRFFTPKTANAIMSWRILVGLATGIALGVAGLPVGVAIGVGVLVYAASVAVAMPKGSSRPAIDPFVLSEPWRQLMQQAQASGRRLRETVAGLDDGPLKQQLLGIAEHLDRGLDEAWHVARRGDEIDTIVRMLGPTRLRSKLDTLQAQAATTASNDTAAAIASVERQIATAARLQQQSDETADSLRHTQSRLDELVARVSEVRVGLVDSDSYARDVDDLIVRLEALHQAVEETRNA